MKSYLYILILLTVYSALGQQEAQYSQYMYNMNIVNPAYVTNTPGIIYFGSLYRTQWTGLEGGPKTGNVFVKVPTNQRTEVSFNYVNDRIGDVLEENSFNMDYAYILQLSANVKLSLGLKAGLSNLAFDFSRTNVNQDPSFQNSNSTLFNMGAGAFLFTDRFYVGISSPNFMPADIDSADENLYEHSTQMYAMAGYVYDLGPSVKLKPSTVLKQSIGAPLTFDVSLNALFYDRFEIGASYRYQDAMAFLAAVDVAHNLRIGYAYDHTTSKLNDFNNGTHEIILLYNFDFLKPKKYTSPRFF
ncbi:MAG: type IX secretion system membrane protein PorP/SprF [Sediminicola sp.]|tara:strand:+ start:132758 stop:133660 length:903 start_codon:yes stop_codon:yes gene_type:complete